MADFSLARFVELSGPVAFQDLDWEAARRAGVTPGEARMLRYISDTEAHTILYMRDLLAGHSARDPEITTFLSIWAYEECWHGRVIDRFLAEVGYAPPPDRFTRVAESSALKELIEALLSQFVAALTRKFAATHMTWGAINELTAAATYQAIERRTGNPVLATLCRRLAKQERKHFSFYYHQAERRLAGDRGAQGLCRFALRNFWDLVGSGVGDDDALGYIADTLFGDEASRRPLAEAEETIAALPGMSWFALICPAVERQARRHRARCATADPPAVHGQEAGALGP
jgi:rubrerythrin